MMILNHNSREMNVNKCSSSSFVSLVKCNAVMNDKQGKHVLGSLLLFVKHSAKVLGSVLVVIIEALFWVFQLIKLMLGAFLAHFLHFVVD